MARKPAAPTPDPATPSAVRERPTVVVTAPKGPRRRAGLAFDRTPRRLTAGELGGDPAATIAALEADPRLVVTLGTDAARETAA